MSKRLFLIDGTALAYRAYFAFAGSRGGGLSTRSGHPTSATYGFTTTLRALLEKEKPHKVVASFDGAIADLERSKKYPDYKSTREKMPDDMLEQLEDIERVTTLHGIPVLRSPGHEADDVIGTLAVQARDAGWEVFIVTGDKDFLQLVGDRIKLWNLRSSTSAPEILGPESCEEKFGVKPEQMIDLLALMGDSSDNVPGVPKVGKKTAAELLQEWGSLDGLLKHLEDVKKPSIKKSLEEHEDQARLSKELVTIHTDVPLDMKLEEIPDLEPDGAGLKELFLELEFDSLAATVDAPQQDEVDKAYTTIQDREGLDALLAELREAGEFAFDTETTGLDMGTVELVGMSFATAAGKAWYVPCNAEPPVVAPEGEQTPTEALVAACRELLEDPEVGKAMQNAKYDLGVLRRCGVEVEGLTRDTMLMSYCCHAGEGSHNLDALALRHFGYTKIPTKEIIGTGKKQKTFAEIEIPKVSEYACEDADFTWRLREKLEDELDNLQVRRVFEELEMPLVTVLLDMESEGIAVDRKHLEQLSREWGGRIDKLVERIHERAGEEFNINSTQKLGEVLFDTLEIHKAAGIKPKKTPTGRYKTDAQVLETLAEHHEVPRMLLEYRQLTKLKSTYVDTLPDLIRESTGRIHTTFNQAVAATGRLSSDNPNLQNIPIRTQEGREVRKAFVPRGKGWTLFSADYSQIELRILAHLSGDESLIQSFQKGEDIHTRTISKVMGIMPEMVTPEQRSQAKAINYGLMYGMGASRLAQQTGMTPPEARKFIQAYFKALPKVKEWLDGTLEKAKEEGEVRTLWGRRRALPDLESSNAAQRIAAENMAVNTPIQGSAADIIKHAMLSVHRELDQRGLRARLLLQVHDELVLDVPEDELKEVQSLVEQCMSGAVDLDVPLEVTMGHGPSWLEAH